MSLILIITNTITISLTFAAWWFRYCSDKTLKQRRVIREQSIYNDEWLTILLMDEVDFSHHTFSLITFRNPWKLYELRLDKIPAPR